LKNAYIFKHLSFLPDKQTGGRAINENYDAFTLMARRPIRKALWHAACFDDSVSDNSYSPIFRMAAGHAESMQAISQNLANCSTPGYRKLQVSHRVFDDMLGEAAKASTARWDGKGFDPLSVDFSEGAIRPTERPLDFSLRGPGFFVITKDGRDYYTRKGDFSLDANGNLMSSNDFPVQGENGPIKIPSEVSLNELTVNEDGTLQGKLPSGIQTLGKLKTVKFNDTTQLYRAGTTMFGAPPEMPAVATDANTVVFNRALEQSNTSIFEELAALIFTVRNYEACQKIIRNDDEKTGKLIQQMSM